MLCECGCGQITGIYKTTYRNRGIIKGQSKRFLLNHHTNREKNIKWNCGINNSGNYIKILMKNHPFAIGGYYVYSHRFIYENFLKITNPSSPALTIIDGEKYLSPDYIVHHKDGNTRNNNLENLELLTKSEHSKLHYVFIPKINGKLTKRSYKNE